MSTDPGSYVVRSLGDLPAHRSTCGFRRQLLTAADNDALSCSVLDIDDAQAHYHKKTTEIYYVLEGEGELVLDGEAVAVRPGTAVLIRPGTRHQGRGGFRTMVICSPPYTPEDQYAD